MSLLTSPLSTRCSLRVAAIWLIFAGPVGAATVTVNFGDLVTQVLLRNGTLLDRCVSGPPPAAPCGDQAQNTIGDVLAPFGISTENTAFLIVDPRFTQDSVGVTSSPSDPNDRLFSFRFPHIGERATLDVISTDTPIDVTVEEVLGTKVSGHIPSGGQWVISINPSDEVATCGTALVNGTSVLFGNVLCFSTTERIFGFGSIQFSGTGGHYGVDCLSYSSFTDPSPPAGALGCFTSSPLPTAGRPVTCPPFDISGNCGSQRGGPTAAIDLSVDQSICGTDQVTAVVANHGSANAPSSTTRITFFVPFSGGFTENNVPTPPVAAGGFQEVQFPYPPGCAPNRNRCTFMINANADRKVSESSLGNNALGGSCGRNLS